MLAAPTGAAMQRRTLFAAATALPAAAQSRLAGAQAPTTVFAAAALQDAMRELGGLWQAASGALPRFVVAASSTLARQIEQGAPADIFASADEAWMDHLAQRGLIVEASRVAPVGNTLVLVAPAGAPVTLARGTDLRALLGPQGRLAVADPAHVPAGRYAQAALQWMGQWPALAPRLARAENVRAALLLVERGEAPLGIVYATDARAARVVVLGAFPPESHAPITHPFALTRRAAPGAAALLAFLTGAHAAPVWRRLGFALPG
jgi:molybdate transport system substrate-binding protein